MAVTGIAMKPEDADEAPEAPPCGSYGSAQRHRKRGEPLDQECRDAERDYMRSYRERRGPGRDRWWNRTRSIALERLAAEYPRRFAVLLAEVRSEGETPWDPGEQS